MLKGELSLVYRNNANPQCESAEGFVLSRKEICILLGYIL